MCCVGFSTINIENDLNVNVDVWSSLDSYQAQGSLLCFAQRAQKISPHEPEGYSKRAPPSFAAQKAMTETVDELIDDPHVVSAAEATDPDVRAHHHRHYERNVFRHFDVSTTGEKATTAPFPSTHEGTIATGDVYVSAMAAARNSEFEFLTGSSMAFGAGRVPLYAL